MKTAELLNLLRCPETYQTLTEAPSETVAKINQKIAAGLLQTRSGQKITEKIDGGFIRQDGLYLYPIRDNLPIMLIDEAISLASLPS